MNLPIEIWNNIIGYLRSTNDIYNITKTCKMFNNIIHKLYETVLNEIKKYKINNNLINNNLTNNNLINNNNNNSTSNNLINNNNNLINNNSSNKNNNSTNDNLTNDNLINNNLINYDKIHLLIKNEKFEIGKKSKLFIFEHFNKKRSSNLITNFIPVEYLNYNKIKEYYDKDNQRFLNRLNERYVEKKLNMIINFENDLEILEIQKVFDFYQSIYNSEMFFSIHCPFYILNITIDIEINNEASSIYDILIGCIKHNNTDLFIWLLNQKKYKILYKNVNIQNTIKKLSVIENLNIENFSFDKILDFYEIVLSKIDFSFKEYCYENGPHDRSIYHSLIDTRQLSENEPSRNQLYRNKLSGNEPSRNELCKNIIEFICILVNTKRCLSFEILNRCERVLNSQQFSWKHLFEKELFYSSLNYIFDENKNNNEYQIINNINESRNNSKIIINYWKMLKNKEKLSLKQEIFCQIDCVDFNDPTTVDHITDVIKNNNCYSLICQFNKLSKEKIQVIIKIMESIIQSSNRKTSRKILKYIVQYLPSYIKNLHDSIIKKHNKFLFSYYIKLKNIQMLDFLCIKMMEYNIIDNFFIDKSYDSLIYKFSYNLKLYYKFLKNVTKNFTVFKFNSIKYYHKFCPIKYNTVKFENDYINYIEKLYFKFLIAGKCDLKTYLKVITTGIYSYSISISCSDIDKINNNSTRFDNLSDDISLYLLLYSSGNLKVLKKYIDNGLKIDFTKISNEKIKKINIDVYINLFKNKIISKETFNYVKNHAAIQYF